MLLYHGTTRTWAEALLKDGPHPLFRVPGDLGPPEGFFAAPAEHRSYAVLAAQSKAELFPDLGGPVLLEFDAPDNIIGDVDDDRPGKAVHLQVEVWFGFEGRQKTDFGITALRASWRTIPKTIVEIES